MTGCCLSRLKIYKQIIENDEQRVLILEDDIRVEYTKASFLEKALEELPDKWELLYLGYLNNHTYQTLPSKLRIQLAYPLLNLLGFNRYNPSHYRCKFPRPYSGHLNLSGYHYGTHSYAVTQAGAKKILEFQTPISMEIDNAIGEMCMREQINAYCVKERVFDQNREMFESIIGST